MLRGRLFAGGRGLPPHAGLGGDAADGLGFAALEAVDGEGGAIDRGGIGSGTRTAGRRAGRETASQRGIRIRRRYWAWNRKKPPAIFTQ